MLDFNNPAATIALARRLYLQNPRFHQYVVKYPDRVNLNITMQVDEALAKGAFVVWSSRNNVA